MKGIPNNLIAFIFGLVSVTFTAYIFLASRNDPGLRMAALVSATSTASALLAIASTLLTGKDLTQNNRDLPPPVASAVPLPPPADPANPQK